MKEVTVQKEQNILDICLQEYGSVSALRKLANDNGIRIDADLVPETKLFVDTDAIINTQLVEYFSANGIVIATGSYVDITIYNGIFDFTFDYTFE